MPLRCPTVVILLLAAGVLVWLNLRPMGYEKELSLRPPDGLDPLTRGGFSGVGRCPAGWSATFTA
jgi:hypothetical protein